MSLTLKNLARWGAWIAGIAAMVAVMRADDGAMSAAGVLGAFALLFGWIWDEERRSLVAFARRCAASPAQCVVQVGGIDVGIVSERDYSAMRLAVHTSGALWLAQAWTVARTAAGVALFFAKYVPLAAFWIGLGAVVMYPADGPSKLAELAQMSAEEFLQATGVLLQASVILLAVSGLVTVLLRGPGVLCSLGWRNRVTDEMERRLRRHVGAPADGPVAVRPAYAFEIRNHADENAQPSPDAPAP